MNKTILLSGVMLLLTSYEANAQLSIQANFGQPIAYVEPGYVEAPDYPSQHYDIHRHRHNDYWAHRQQEERGRNQHADRGHPDNSGNHGSDNRGHK